MVTGVSTAVESALGVLREAGVEEVSAGLILGSGLSYLAAETNDPITIPYETIPGFPRSTVEGHAGNFVVGDLEGVRVAFAQGRFHLYEGHAAPMVSVGVRVLAGLGARYLFVTNAAGSIEPRHPPGTLMAISDHINLQFVNPLIGRSPERIDNAFPDMSAAYDPDLRERLAEVAADQSIELRHGVYAGVLGPSYETSAEIGMLRRLGADAVGMSTVPEVVTAAELELPVVGVSLITNLATGLAPEPLTHDEVTEIAETARDRFGRLVRAFVVAEKAGFTG